MGSCVGSSGLNLLGSKSAKGPWGGGGYKEGVPIRVGVAAWRPTHLNSASCLILAALSSSLAPTAELLYTQTHTHTYTHCHC